MSTKITMVKKDVGPAGSHVRSGNAVAPMSPSTAVVEVASVRVPTTDLNKCVRLTFVDYVLSVVGLLLLVTDIFRSGLSTMDAYQRIEPNQFAVFGPGHYPVIDIVANNSNPSNVMYSASKNGTRQNVSRLWSYKYDTLTIPQRALAVWLNVSTYPPCVLYHEACPNPDSLALSTTFTMIDDLIEAIHHQLHDQDPRNAAPLMFMTKNVWIDRLHHLFVQAFSTHVQTRIHHAYHFVAGDDRALNLCSPTERRRWAHASHYLRPVFCDLIRLWPCPDKDLNATFPIPTHIAARYAQLQRQNTDLQLDLTLLTTQRTSNNRFSWDSLPKPQAYLQTDAWEITTWIRGRQCERHLDSNGSRDFIGCKTVLLSDYRYEFSINTHNAKDWASITAILRVFGQAYVWLRLSMHFIGAVATQRHEIGANDFPSLVFWKQTLRLFLMIPPQVLVYGTWAPVLAHALAHTIDSCVIHFASEQNWTTFNGVFSFEVHHLVAMTIQMRNTWYIALALQLWLLWQVHGWRSRHAPWWHHDGVRCVREMLIGLLSGLTLFAPVRKLTFRDSRVLETHLIPPRSLSTYLPSSVDTFAMVTGVFFDVKTLILSCCVVVSGTAFLLLASKLLLLLGRQHRHKAIKWSSIVDVLMPRTGQVPVSAGVLWPLAMLTVHCPAYRGDRDHIPQEIRSIDVRVGTTTKRISQSFVAGDSTFDIQRRTVVFWTIVRVLNMSMMTDPLVFVRVRLSGQRVYVFKVPGPSGQTVVLLPANWIEQRKQFGDELSLGNGLKLNRVEMSSNVPWEHLLLCG